MARNLNIFILPKGNLNLFDIVSLFSSFNVVNLHIYVYVCLYIYVYIFKIYNIKIYIYM